MHLSQQPPATRVSLETLAQRFNMNRHHLNKVSQRLVALGWIESARGKQGGVSLIASALTLKLGDIVAALEPDTRPMDCEGVACPLAGRCQLECILLAASNDFLNHLNRYRLSDLGQQGSLSRRLQALNLP